MAKWSRKKKRYMQYRAQNEAVRTWRRCHAADGVEKAVYADEERALLTVGHHAAFTAYYCEDHQGWHVGHRKHRFVRMNARAAP